MNIINSCTCINPYEYLPRIDFPFYNESLIGYLLRLDYLNGFTSSSIINICLREENKGFSHITLNENNIEDLEEHIDLNILSRLTNLSTEYLNKMKISTIRKKLFKYNCTATKRNFHYGELKICPECIKQWRVPQVFLFDSVTRCLQHGFELISICNCNKKIDLLNSKYDLVCNKCETKYSDIKVTVEHTSSEYDSEYVFQEIFKAYLSEDIPVIMENEKLVIGLINRINYLENIKYVAYKSILGTDYANKNSKIIFQRYSRNINDLLILSNIIALLNEFNMSPFQFFSLNSNDFKAYVTAQIESITYRSTAESGKKQKSGLYFFNLKGNRNNQWNQSWYTISALAENRNLILFNVKVTAGRNIFNLKCGAF